MSPRGGPVPGQAPRVGGRPAGDGGRGGDRGVFSAFSSARAVGGAAPQWGLRNLLLLVDE